MKFEEELQFEDTKKEEKKKEKNLRIDLITSVFPLVDDMEASKEGEVKDSIWEKILEIRKKFLEKGLPENEIDKIIKMRMEAPDGKLKEVSSKLRPEFEPKKEESGGSSANKE